MQPRFISCTEQDCSNNLSRIELLIYIIKTLDYLVLTLRWLCVMLLHFFGTPCPGAITSLHFSHGHILVIWKLDAGVCLGVYWICSERRSSCSVKSKALRASQLKDVKGKNLDTFDIRALVFPRHPKERQSKSRWPRATDLQPNLFGESKDVNYCEYINILDYICWFMMNYVWRVPCKRDE